VAATRGHLFHIYLFSVEVVKHKFEDEDILGVDVYRGYEAVIINKKENLDGILLSIDDIAHLAESLGFRLVPDIGEDP